MKKYLAFGLCIVLIAALFTSCSVFKGEAEKESNTKNTSLDSSDLPTVTDKDGNIVEYTVPTSEDNTDEDGVQNPYLTVGSLDDINKEAGTNIKSPTGLNVTNEEFDINDSYSQKIACYSFMVGYKDYSIWAGKKTGGMLMGIYLDDGTKIGEDFEGTEEISPTKYEDFCVARWFADGIQYNLYAENVSLEEFKTVYNSIQ